MNNLQGWRKPYMVILTIITIIAVIIGVCYHILNFKHSGISNYLHIGSISNSNAEQCTNDINPGDTVTKITIECSIADVVIKSGDKLNVHYDYPEGSLPKVEMKGTELVITQKSETHFNSPVSEDYKLEITIPENSELIETKIEVNMGNVKFKDFSSTAFTCLTNMGNIELDNISAATFKADSSMGNIEVSGLNCNSVTADCSMGNIELYGTASNIKADCSMGNVTIKTDNADAIIDANCNLGNCTVNGKQM